MPAAPAARAHALAARVRSLLDDVALAAGPETWTGPAASELDRELAALRGELAAAADELARAAPRADALRWRLP